MRLLRAKDFLKVIKGEDIEFRIKPYEIQLKEKVVIEGVRSIYSLEFPKIKFKELIIRNCEFSGGLKLNHLEGRAFTFEKSKIKGLTLLGSRVDRMHISENIHLGELHFDKTAINNLDIARNESFNRFHLGCHNNVLRATISHNGVHNSGMTDSSVYICPERFGEIDIQNMHANKVEIGTFGEHSRLSVNGVVTDEFKIENCDHSKSQVSLKNIRPMGEQKSQLTIKDSKLDETVLEQSAISQFNDLSIENSEVGSLKNAVDELQRLQKARFWKRSISSMFLW